MESYISNSTYLILVHRHAQAAMLLQLLDMTAGLTLVFAPAVATVRQRSLSVHAPTAAIVQQQGSPFSACPYRAYREEQQIT